MQEADPDALLMLPGCQVRLKKHSQILQVRPCHQGEERTQELALDGQVPLPCREPSAVTQYQFVQSHQRSLRSK